MQYYHTIKYLKPIQIYGRLRVRLKQAKINLSAASLRRPIKSCWIASIQKAEQSEAPSHLTFLNQKREVSSPTIWNDKTIDKLWRYNLHYFDFLNTPDSHTWQIDFIKRWINENPFAKGDGWEPYALSLRIVNWIKWSLANHYHDPYILYHLTIQTRYLYKSIEIHLLGNHILANAKALLFAGLFFEGSEADKWLNKGYKLLNKEFREQILTDGGHFELSTMYQAILLEDLLDVINICQTYEYSIPKDWPTLSVNMFKWLKTMCHQDNDISFFNDATLGVAPKLHELDTYQQRIGIKQPIFPAETLTYLADSGYCRVHQGNLLLLADVANVRASYQPGHTHADTLSFELSIGGQRLIVNSGISTYNENAERTWQRSSQAHNCLIINDQDSSEIWKSFRVGRRAKVRHVIVQNKPDGIILKASHDGYYREYKIWHNRTWHMTLNQLTIRDEMSGKGNHKIDLIFHIHPLIKLEQKNSNCILFYDAAQSYLATLQIDQPIKILDSSFHPGFNLSISNKKLQISGKYQLPMEIETIIKWNI